MGRSIKIKRMDLRRRLDLLLAIMLPVCAVACRQPSSVETFLRPDQVSLDGSYRFSVDMSDTTAVYDISFYTLMDGDFSGSFPVNVRVKSPSGRKFEDHVYWDVSDQEVLYRKDISPCESGEWEISVYVDKLKGMRGMGLICGKHN